MYQFERSSAYASYARMTPDGVVRLVRRLGIVDERVRPLDEPAVERREVAVRGAAPPHDGRKPAMFA